MCRRSAIVVALTAAIALPTAAGAAVEAPRQTWVPDGEVKAVAVSGSTAYIGGNFTRIAPYTGSSALFDASNGEVKRPWPEVVGVVNAVAPDSAGGWYLGGDFTSVGGVPRTDLAHVMSDGTVDLSWAPVTDGLVRALAVTPDTVFAGGYFSTANGTPRSSLAGFSPATGALTDFVGGVSGEGSIPVTLFDPLGVYSLLAVGSTLYTVGEFNEARSGSTTGVERRRGVAFNIGNSQIQAWNPSTNRLINGIARDSDGSDLFIGGRFTKVNVAPTPGQDRNGVAKVDEAAGTADPNWVAPLLGGTDLTTLMVSGPWVYLAGNVNVGPNQTWPVAAYSTANNNAGINISWHPVPAGTVQSLAAAGSTVYIGSGSFVNGLPQPHIIGVPATNFPQGSTPSFAPALGRGRQALPSGQSAGVRAIGASGTDVVAGGTFINAGGVDRRNLAAIDLGTGEPTAFNPPMKSQSSALLSVNALAITSDGLVWAGGVFVTEGPNERTGLAAFDPASGALASFHRDLTGGGAFGSPGNALVASDRTVYVAGGFSQIGGMPRRNIAAVQNVPGEEGTVLPFDGDVDGPVNALALAGDKVYIGGQFTSVNGSIASLKRDRRNLAALDATTGLDRGWDPDADNVVRALALEGDTVFAGGDFTTVNHGVARQRLAAFDGAGGGIRDWNPGADAPVNSLATFGSTVFAGGDFATAGGVPRTGVAELDAQTGAPGAFSPALGTEERGGPVPPMTRVGALSASAATGLLMGGSYVMSSPAPRAANLSLFGLAPLPPGGGDGTDPTLALSASRKRFRTGRGRTRAEGNATPARTAARRKRTPAGTTLRLRLSEAARVRFQVRVRTRGRRVGGRCVKQTRRNRNRRRCIRLVAKRPAFTRSAPLGRSRVRWSGRLSRKALKPGRYILRATPTDLAGNTGKARQLKIRIVRR